MWTRLEASFDLFGLALICALPVVLLLQEKNVLATCWEIVRVMRAVRYHSFPPPDPRCTHISASHSKPVYILCISLVYSKLRICFTPRLCLGI